MKVNVDLPNKTVKMVLQAGDWLDDFIIYAGKDVEITSELNDADIEKIKGSVMIRRIYSIWRYYKELRDSSVV